MFNFYYGTTNDNYKGFSGSGKAHVLIFNDSTSNDIFFSIDGQSESGIIKASEGLDFHNVSIEKLHLKNFTTGNDCPFRLWFYGKQLETEKLTTINSARIPKGFLKV